jgi:putative flippase GtrA
MQKNKFISMLKQDQRVSYLLVGALNTGLVYLLYLILTWLGIRYYYALTVCTLIGIFISFNTNSRLVFKEKNQWSIIRYLITWLGLYLSQLYIIRFTIESLPNEKHFGFILSSQIGGLIGLIFSVVVGYFIQKHWVFISDIKSKA